MTKNKVGRGGGGGGGGGGGAGKHCGERNLYVMNERKLRRRRRDETWGKIR